MSSCPQSPTLAPLAPQPSTITATESDRPQATATAVRESTISAHTPHPDSQTGVHHDTRPSGVSSVLQADSVMSDGIDAPVNDGQTLLAEWDRRGRLSTRLPGTQGARDSSPSGARINSTIIGSSPPRARVPSQPSGELVSTTLTERQRVDEARRLHRERMANSTVHSHDQTGSATDILGMDVNLVPSLSRPRGGRPSKQELAYRELFQQGLSKEQIVDELQKRRAEETERQRTKARVRHRPKAERRTPMAWTLPEIQRLVPLWYKLGNKWAEIKEIDSESPEPQLERRTQVDLKDKMRQLTKWMSK